MRIVDTLFSAGIGSFFYDDQAAIRAGREADGFVYRGAAITPGFTSIRTPARSLSIGLVLEDGTTAWGDMMSVQYSGAAGRDPLFDPANAETVTRELVAPLLVRLDLWSFRNACETVLSPNSARLTRAIEYGVSQALLRAAGHVRRQSMAEVICSEYGCPLVPMPVPILAQSGDALGVNVDKMILKRADILPHGLVNSKAKFGTAGATFSELVRWVARRVKTLGTDDYHPILHFDVYGWMGLELGLDVGAIADYIARLAEAVAPLRLHIECPADFGSRQAQIDGYSALVAELHRKGSTARIVVDERCNTLEDIRAFAVAGGGHIAQIKMPDVGSVNDTILAALECKRNGMGAYIGGSCAETDLSATVSVHVAVATQAQMMLAKPGMGVDEALTIVGNEQNRLLALLRR